MIVLYVNPTYNSIIHADGKQRRKCRQQRDNSMNQWSMDANRPLAEFVRWL